MKVYVLSEYYNNGLLYEDEVEGDVIMGVYSTYDKAKQTAMEFKPHSFNVDENERIVTDIQQPVHMREGTVRDVKEYVDKYHMYEYELYITEIELDAPPRADE